MQPSVVADAASLLGQLTDAARIPSRFITARRGGLRFDHRSNCWRSCLKLLSK